MHCAKWVGDLGGFVADVVGGLSQRNAVFPNRRRERGPAAVGRGVPISGPELHKQLGVGAGWEFGDGLLSAVVPIYDYLFVVAAGTSGNADTITSYYSAAVAFTGGAVSMQQTGQAKLDTGGAYTSAVVDEDGNYGDAIVTETRTATSAGGTWLYNNVFGTATKLLGPGGVALPAVNSFIIHNPTDGGGGLLVLVNQDGPDGCEHYQSAAGYDAIHDHRPWASCMTLWSRRTIRGTLTLPSVAAITSGLDYYAMLGAVYNPGDHKIYAVVGGGTSTGSIQRLIMRVRPVQPERSGGDSGE